MGFPDGNEKGPFLALDLGGTNLRVCEVVLLKEGRKFDMIQSKYKLVGIRLNLFLMIASAYQNGDWGATI
jgi:hexokinase